MEGSQLSVDKHEPTVARQMVAPEELTAPLDSSWTDYETALKQGRRREALGTS
jgi:hypothetical protein